MLGDGGTRNAAGWGFGARLFAGEKCCWSVEKVGLLNCGSDGWASSAPFLVGSRRAVEEVKSVEEDFVRECPGPFVLAERVLADTLRRWRDCVSGGLDRSFFTGSESVGGTGFGRRPEVDLCKPPVVGLLMFAREGGGGGRIEALLITLPVELGGREMVVLRVGGLGSRLGDWPVLSARETLLPSLGSRAVCSYLLPASAGLRRDRVLEGRADMVSSEVVLLTIEAS